MAKAKKRTRRNKKTAKSSKLSIYLWGLKWVTIGVIWSAVLVSCLIVWFGCDLPDTNRLLQTTRQPGIQILAQDGTTIATYGDIYGTTVTLKQLPDYVPNAILATEDRRFYSHFGIDVLGIARAAWINYQAKRVVQGGSTITQQLAKNFLLSERMYNSSDRSIRRKVQEAMLSLWLERKFTKRQILNIYLNRVYLGAGTYGIEAASQRYFGKRARNLTLYEAAVIAGLLKAPSRYSPLSNPKLADARARTVLNNMVEAEFITAQDKENIKTSTSHMHHAHAEAITGRYFADWIIETLPDYVGEVNQDIVVVTTLNPKLQRLAEAKAAAIIANHGAKKQVEEVAMVAMKPNGEVKAMVGGHSYFHTQFNRATQALRQSGSAFKLFVYLAALEAGYRPDSAVADTPVRIGKWRPKNYGWKSRGKITLTDSLAYSVNTSTVRIGKQVGKGKIIETAKRLGISNPIANDLSIVLGSVDTKPIEITAAYATVANQGRKALPYGVVEIRNRNGRILYRRKAMQGPQVVTRLHAEQLKGMLAAVTRYGTGRAAAINRFCGGKTGTTQNYRDAWFIGFAQNPNLITGIWMGNDNSKRMKKVTGGGLPAQLWKQFMQEATRA